MSDTAEVAYDDLDYVEAMFLRNGRPFSGVTVDRDDSGKRIGEVPFQDGQEHGVARAWHPNGQLLSETPYVRGSRHGLRREWFAGGALRSETYLEDGWPLKKSVWDENGNLLERYERPTSDPVYEAIVKRRARERQ